MKQKVSCKLLLKLEIGSLILKEEAFALDAMLQISNKLKENLTVI